MTLRECIAEAEKRGIAIGHFNISDSEGFKAVVEGARELGVPVIIGVSEGEREFIGLQEIVSLVNVARGNGLSVYINADHTYSVEKARKAIDAGVDSVIIDEADKTFEDNISITKDIVQYSGGRVLVEGELGFIGKSSKVLDRVPDGVTQTTPKDAKRFVEETGIDLLAPAVGNVHGIVTTGEPKLNIELIRAIRDAVKIPLVLHGASGNSDEEIIAAIDAGIRIVHINTELRLAYKEGLKEAVQSGEIAPYKFMEAAVENMKEVVKKKLKLFNKI
ncbi:MAG: class II fructose-bisphosphate aldolase [Candidatus Zambryskibacteria bacterium]|nr:class II fructose-bisphosphate aldolase [Candidatus Zambryskibacteria bacterium]